MSDERNKEAKSPPAKKNVNERRLTAEERKMQMEVGASVAMSNLAQRVSETMKTEDALVQKYWYKISPAIERLSLYVKNKGRIENNPKYNEKMLTFDLNQCFCFVDLVWSKWETLCDSIANTFANFMDKLIPAVMDVISYKNKHQPIGIHNVPRSLIATRAILQSRFYEENIMDRNRFVVNRWGEMCGKEFLKRYNLKLSDDYEKQKKMFDALNEKAKKESEKKKGRMANESKRIQIGRERKQRRLERDGKVKELRNHLLKIETSLADLRLEREGSEKIVDTHKVEFTTLKKAVENANPGHKENEEFESIEEIGKFAEVLQRCNAIEEKIVEKETDILKVRYMEKQLSSKRLDLLNQIKNLRQHNVKKGGGSPKNRKRNLEEMETESLIYQEKKRGKEKEEEGEKKEVMIVITEKKEVKVVEKKVEEVKVVEEKKKKKEGS